MGRYYNGDIEGKFWLGVQPSNDADFFGVEGYQPERLEYYFTQDDLAQVKKGIKKCKEVLGENKKRLDDFFIQHDAYNDTMLKEAGLEPSLLEWYARLDLGENIRKCLVKQGECNFEAEL